MIDAYGYTLSTRSTEAADAYNRGIRRVLETRSGGDALLQRAIELDDGFALPRIALAPILAARGKREQAAALREQAIELANHATDRERRHVQVLAGQQAQGRAYLEEFPRDALVLEQVLRHLFFFGGPGRAIEALAIVESCRGAYPEDDWFFPARHAFYLQELHRYDEAAPLAERAVALNPENGNAIHALAHVLHGRGRHAEAGAVLTAMLTHYDGVFRSHFHWHIGITSVEAADPWATFDHQLRPGKSAGPAHLALADAVGFLWSCTVLGLDATSRWRELRPLVDQLTAVPGQPFIDVHAALALAAMDDRAALAALLATLHATPAGSSARWGLPVVEAIAAMAAGELRDAEDRLVALTDAQREAIGGSNIERGLIDEILIAICRRAGRAETLAALQQRFAARPPVHPLLASLVRDAR